MNILIYHTGESLLVEKLTEHLAKAGFGVVSLEEADEHGSRELIMEMVRHCNIFLLLVNKASAADKIFHENSLLIWDHVTEDEEASKVITVLMDHVKNYKLPTLKLSSRDRSDNSIIRIVHLAEEVRNTLEKVQHIPNVPLQTLAPIECNWYNGQLRMIIHSVNNPDKANDDGRRANFEHLKSECERLRNEFIGNNAARRVGNLLDRYAEVLDRSFEILDIYHLGHAGIALRAAANGASDILSDASNAELAGLLTCHELFVRQDPKWNKYLEVASRANFNAKLLQDHSKFAEGVTELLRSFYPVVDNNIPNLLSELLNDIADMILQASIQCYGYWKSIENIILVLVEKALEFATEEAEDFSKIFIEASQKFAGDFAEETRKQIIAKGALAVATAIIAVCGYGLVEIAGCSDLLFSWFKPAKDFLESIAKAKR